MTSYKFPGVYPSIKDLSGVVATNAVTACAYVGEAEYGPINEPSLISSIQDYTNKFGKISSTYGYAGYSLAVAAESINEHHFVRVVPTGDPAEALEARVNNAKWAAGVVGAKGAAGEHAIVPTGYFYEEFMAASESSETSGDSGLFNWTDAGTPVADDTNAFLVMAADPNNRSLYFSVSDTTINEYKASAPISITYTEMPGVEKTKIIISLPDSYCADMEIGAYMVVSKMENEILNGIFEIEMLEPDATNANYTLVTYEVQATTIPTDEDIVNARAGSYPDLNETTFSVSVSEKIGRVMQVLETYEFCTLYAATDNFGNSTYVEDVINGSSDYIKVFVNKNFVEDDAEAVIIPLEVTDVYLAGGNAGKWDDANVKNTDLNEAWELFRDRSRTNVSILMNSGYVNKTNVAYQSKMLEIAEHRRDCFCLFDAPMTETEYENVIEWRKNIQGFNSYRGAVVSPWVKTYDAMQGRSNFVMCPSAYVAKIMGSAQPWVAPAGLNRGILGASAVSPTGLTQYYNDVQGGILYTDNQINCIIKNPASGYVNWGQRTLQAKPSALDRINVARTVIYIETILRDAARWHIFENNTSYQRMQITVQFSNFLNTILSAEGIQKYQVVCDESNNTAIVIANNQLVVDIYLWPTYTAEVILLNSTIMGADATVSVSSS